MQHNADPHKDLGLDSGESEIGTRSSHLFQLSHAIFGSSTEYAEKANQMIVKCSTVKNSSNCTTLPPPHFPHFETGHTRQSALLLVPETNARLSCLGFKVC